MARTRQQIESRMARLQAVMKRLRQELKLAKLIEKQRAERKRQGVENA